MTAPPLSGVSARHWLVVFGSGLLMSLNVLMFLSVGLLLPPLAKTLGVGLGQVTLYVTVSMAASAVMLTLAGSRLLLRFGARRLSIGGGLVTGVLLAAVSQVNSLPQLYLLAFGVGLFPAVSMQMTWAAMINDWFEARRGQMQGIVVSVASLGGVVAGAALPPVVIAAGWRGGFLFAGAVCVVLTLVAGLMIRSRPDEVGLAPFGATADADADSPASPAHWGPTRAEAVRSPQFVALIVALPLFAAIMAVQQHYPSVAAEHGLSLATAGALLSMLSVANIAATLAVGTMSDRLGPLRTYLVLGTLLVVALGVITFTFDVAGQAIGLLLLALPAVCPPILTPTVLRHTFGDRAFVPLLGVTTATMPVGIAIGSPLWGLVKDVTGSFELGLTIAAGLTVVIVAMVSFALITGPRRWREAPPAEVPEAAVALP